VYIGVPEKEQRAEKKIRKRKGGRGYTITKKQLKKHKNVMPPQ